MAACFYILSVDNSRNRNLQSQYLFIYFFLNFFFYFFLNFFFFFNEYILFLAGAEIFFPGLPPPKKNFWMNPCLLLLVGRKQDLRFLREERRYRHQILTLEVLIHVLLRRHHLENCQSRQNCN